MRKFSRWPNDANLHDQLNRFVDEVNGQIAQVSASIPKTVTTPAPAEAAAQGGGVGSSTVGGSSISAGTGISTSSSGGGVMVSNTGVISIAGQGINTTLGAATVDQKAERVTTGSIPLSSTVQVTLTWSVAFADALYTPVVSIVDSSGFLAVVNIASFDAATVVVNVQNTDASNPHTGVLCVLALHD